MKNKPYQFILLIFLFIGGGTSVFSQGQNFTFNYSQAQEFFQDINGRPLYLKAEYIVEGNPFHPMSYYKATVFFPGGKAYTNVPVKLNLIENSVIYTTPDGTELSLVNPVKKIVFTDTSDFGAMNGVVFEKGFASVGNLDYNSFYEVLDSGGMMLLKNYRVYYNDKKQYGSANISRVFEEEPSYYICLPDKTMKKIDKGQEELLAIIPEDKKKVIRNYISKNDLKCKKVTDWKKVVSYYNSL